MDNLWKFSKKLRVVIQQDGRNQRKLAELAGITPVTLSRWLSGKREPREAELQKLMAILGSSIEEFKDNALTTEEGLTAEEWRERALAAEAELAALRAADAATDDGLTAEAYLARLRESMRFVFHFITQEDKFKN